MTQLYVLAHEYKQACDTLADLDLDAQTIADTLEGMSGDLEAKATAVGMFARNLEATAAAIKAAEAQMAHRRKALEYRADQMRDYLLRNMQHAGISKIEGAYLRISIRDNPSAVEVFDASQLPSVYMRQPEPPPPAPDKAAIKAALAAGADVPGARLTCGQRLDVR